jgi:16S rRNA (guanine527-N7)-methyltransferase
VSVSQFLEGVAEILRYFPHLSPIQQTHMHQLGSIYYEWNARLNLISRKDLPNLYIRHILHALSIARLIQFYPHTRLLDVGTGGGFPGIPLAIYFPLAHFHLVDSVAKKIRAVEAIVQGLGLSNVTTTVSRVENLPQATYDFVLGRAVTQLPTFYYWTYDKINPASCHSLANGILYLKGNDTVAFHKDYTVYPLQQWFADPFFETKQLVYIPVGKRSYPTAVES